METTRCALICLLSACLWRESCTSSIKLCTDSPTSFVNGTAIPAMLGKPVSVVFCVQCHPRLRIMNYIKIKHINHPTFPENYYTNNKYVWRPIIVNITFSANKATINITIKTVRKQDFTDQFSVTINTYKGFDDNSVFFFRLSDAVTSGAVFPCSKNDTQFRNRTLFARMGGTASFTFCAESSVRVFERINISHPNHKDGWYPPPAGVEETLEVKVKIHHHTTTITITVNKLQPTDFRDTFAVTLYPADETGKRINGASTFFFVIEETGNDITVLITPLTSTVEDTTPLLTDLRNTTTGYAEQWGGRRRYGMCHVIDDICLMVFVGSRNLTPRDQCAAENASHVADFNSIEILKPCLTDLLLFNPVKIVRLGETRYIDTRNWTEVHPQSPYRVPCLIAKQQLADPVITWFTLQQWGDQRETILWQHNLLDRNNTSVTIPETKSTLNVTCRASGYPKPEIVILRDNETLEMSPDGMSWQLNNTFYGELICQATNVLKSGPTHISVLVSAPAGLETSDSPSPAVGAVAGGIVAVALVAIIIVVVICLLKRKGAVSEGENMNMSTLQCTQFADVTNQKTYQKHKPQRTHTTRR